MDLLTTIFWFFGFKYLANRNSLEVHDLDNLKTQCSVHLMAFKNKHRLFSLSKAHKMGYDNCRWCIGNSLR